MKGERSLSDVFREFLTKDAEFSLAKKIVLQNSAGRNWLIGGHLYRSLAYLLYGTLRPSVDFDFVVEEPREKTVLPVSFELKENRYDNPKFVGKTFSIDFVPLATIHSINRRRLKPTIENYLTGTPLTVQSIAYEIGTSRLIGDVGIRALLCKEVGVNNLSQAKIYAEKKGQSIEEIIRKKADSLGFKPVILQ